MSKTTIEIEMSKYERDEINFHIFLNMMRQIHNVSMIQLADGLYNKSNIKRIETGERIPEKLMRDRLMARMGVSGENYEDYLQNDEYDRWKMRQDMLNCVERKQWETLENVIREYDTFEECSVAEEQFLVTMRLWLCRNQNASVELQRELIEQAVTLTTPKVTNGFLDDMLLAEQELELLIEYLELYNDGNNAVDETAWKLQQYEEILNYIDHSRMDDVGRAKIYPKAALCFGRLTWEKARNYSNVCKALKICNHAIELLRNTQKLYYFVELLEIRIQFYEFIMDSACKVLDEKRAKNLLPVIKETKEWRDEIKALYIKYDIFPYMEHDCHIFREPQCNSISDVIRTRRNMMRMSRAELCEGICSVRSLMDLENRKLKKTHMPIVRELFVKLGLCAEYTRARVVSSNFEAIQLVEKIAKCLNGVEDLHKAEEHLRQLENYVCMDIPYNRQSLIILQSSIEFCKNNLTKEMYIEQIMKALECTLFSQKLMNSTDYYMTREEISCVYNIAVRWDNTDNPYIRILEEICKEYKDKDIVATKLDEYDLIMTGVANHLGTMGQYDKSDEISESILKECLHYRRMHSLATNIYNIIWNYRKQKIQSIPMRGKCAEITEIRRCIMLANIAKSGNRMKFYQKMLDEWEKDV